MATIRSKPRKTTPRTKRFLERKRKIYMVGVWASAGVWELPFERFDKKTGNPLVWFYDDANGAFPRYWLYNIEYVTTGGIIMWTFNERLADFVASTYNRLYELEAPARKKRAEKSRKVLEEKFGPAKVQKAEGKSSKN